MSGRHMSVVACELLQGAVDEGGITSCVRQTMRQAVGRNMLDLLNIL
jgi:hypothetical protein